MAYDFSAAVKAATDFVNHQEASGNGVNSYRYPLVYPQPNGTIVVRLLFNPKSSQILRLVNRHEKIACYKTYGIECPICKVMEQVKDMTGQDPFGRTKASRARGICFAQYISSTYPISKGENRGNVQSGETILFMYPWSVYQQLNTLIQAVAQSPTGMDQAFCHAQTGLIVQVNVDAGFKYTTSNVPYMTIQTNQSDEDFIKMLDGMDSLNEQVLPSTINETVDKQVKEYANAIYNQYIAPRTPTYGVPQNTAPQNMNSFLTPIIDTRNTGSPYVNFNQTINQTTATQGTGSVSYPNVSGGTLQGFTAMNPPEEVPFKEVAQANSNQPNCFGKHQANTAQCLCCPVEVDCMSVSR